MKKISGEAPDRRRVLVIGSTDHPDAHTCIKWTQRLPYVADYDAVIVNLTSLDTDLLGKLCDRREPNLGFPPGGEIVINELQKVRKDFLELLRSGGDVYCVVSDVLESESRLALRNGELVPCYTNLDWSPIRFRLVKKAGETIIQCDDRLSQYVEAIGKWNRYIDPNFDDSYVRTEVCDSSWHTFVEGGAYQFVREDIVTTRAGHPLVAAAFWRSLNIKLKEMYRSGTFFALIAPTKISISEGIDILIEPHLGQYDKQPPWLDSIEVPSEKRKRARISESLQEVSTLKNELEAEGRCKKLLFASGGKLERAVAEAFRELGFDVQEAGGKQEDLIIPGENADILIEVKGKKRSIALNDLRQLAQYLTDAEVDGRMVKGLFVGNHYRRDHPAKRPDAFPSNVSEFASRRGIALMTTVDLFNMLCAYREQKIDHEAITSAIHKSCGLVCLPEF